MDAITFAQISKQATVLSSRPTKIYKSGDNVVFTHGAFREIQAIYEEADGDKRVILMFDLLSKPVRVSVPVRSLKRG